jgi:hypothetical protein
MLPANLRLTPLIILTYVENVRLFMLQCGICCIACTKATEALLLATLPASVVSGYLRTTVEIRAAAKPNKSQQGFGNRGNLIPC